MKITENFVSLSSFWDQIQPSNAIEISSSVIQKVKKNRAYLQNRLDTKDEALYGINTGFGSLCNVEIKSEELGALQHNLVVSHACGLGDKVPFEVVKTMVALKIKNLCQGYSGVRWELIERLQQLFNAGIFPVIYEMGSLGASGDLAPLAHLSLPLIGLGEVYLNGEQMKTQKALDLCNIKPIKLSFKEGLALLNGTQFSLAYAVHATMNGQKLLRIANATAALSIIAFGCKSDPFHPLLQKIRRHEGQIKVAEYIFNELSSATLSKTIFSVQDPYSFRCVPQVHGATMMAIEHTSKIVENEVNAVTDNPNVFDEEDLVLIGGNFHAQALALPMDYLAIALSELGSISERRTYQLINGDRDLPSYLAGNPGLNSGFMICQYTAASIVSQNKQLCTPASVDSIVSSKGQEDHVSMASNAGTKLHRVVNNVFRILSIEWMAAAQALEFRNDIKLSDDLQNLFSEYRKHVSRLGEDRVLYPDIIATENFLRKKF